MKVALLYGKSNVYHGPHGGVSDDDYVIGTTSTETLLGVFEVCCAEDMEKKILPKIRAHADKFGHAKWDDAFIGKYDDIYLVKDREVVYDNKVNYRFEFRELE